MTNSKQNEQMEADLMHILIVAELPKNNNRIAELSHQKAMRVKVLKKYIEHQLALAKLDGAIEALEQLNPSGSNPTGVDWLTEVYKCLEALEAQKQKLLSEDK